MSSREIAEMTGKRHDHVMTDVTKMLQDIGKDVPSFRGIYLDSMNRERECYNLPEDLTLTLVSGYRADLRYAIVKELEQRRRGAWNPTVPMG
ncbi:MAG: Rha family transcriptional regulator [Sinobacteraceae bacterium]|nr:Rha family transcriptional regulator [Nevskiaceae bacterium]